MVHYNHTCVCIILPTQSDVLIQSSRATQDARFRLNVHCLSLDNRHKGREHSYLRRRGSQYGFCGGGRRR